MQRNRHGSSEHSAAAYRWQLRMLVPWFSFLEPTSSSQPSAVWRVYKEKIVRVWILREAVKLCSEWWENSSYGKLRLRPHFFRVIPFRETPASEVELSATQDFPPSSNSPCFYSISLGILSSIWIQKLRDETSPYEWRDLLKPLSLSLLFNPLVYLKLKNLGLTGKHSALQSFPYKDTI